MYYTGIHTRIENERENERERERNLEVTDASSLILLYNAVWRILSCVEFSSENF